MGEARAAEVVADERIDGFVLAEDEAARERRLAFVKTLAEGGAGPRACRVEGAGQSWAGPGQQLGGVSTQLQSPPLTAREVGKPRLGLAQRAGRRQGGRQGRGHRPDGLAPGRRGHSPSRRVNRVLPAISRGASTANPMTCTRSPAPAVSARPSSAARRQPPTPTPAVSASAQSSTRAGRVSCAAQQRRERRKRGREDERPAARQGDGGRDGKPGAEATEVQMAPPGRRPHGCRRWPSAAIVAGPMPGISPS